MGIQNRKNLNFENFGILRTKWPLRVGLVVRHKENYKGDKWWLPPSSSHGESHESMFARGSFVHQKCSNYALTNFLFGLCKSMWMIDQFVICLSPYLRALTRPSTPKVLWVRECTPTPCPSIVFTFGLAIESI
jgi:hypothetical protein